ncbi:MAG: response regulator [Spirochaetaceae bacterium]|jgi:putative two-component system response regulator|nr:response regulator [Spirochaetaceae bacterium]
MSFMDERDLDDERDARTILVIDDTPFNLRTLKTLLEEKYKILLAKSGGLALKMLENAKPDLILLDIEMPEMSGFAVMRELQRTPEYADIPVICFTSHLATETFVQQVIEAGFKGYIRKPFETEVLFSKIESIFGINNDDEYSLR